MSESDKTKEQLLEEIANLQKENSILRSGNIVEKKYCAIFEQSSDALMLVDVKTGIKLEYNNRACENLGYTREEFKNIGLMDVKVSEPTDELQKYPTDLVNGSVCYETELRRKDGQIRDNLIRVQLIIFDDGKKNILIQCTDITEQKLAEKLIKEKQQKLEELSSQLLMAFEASNEGLYDFNFSTNVLFFSPTWYKMLGYEPYELPSTIDTVKNLFHPEDKERVAKIEREFITQNKERLVVDFRIRTKSGVYKWISSRGKAVEFDSNGRVKRIMGALIDITDLKEAQEEIRDLSIQVFTAQENERQKIARDLHDNIAQNLSSLKILLQALIADQPALSLTANNKTKYITDIIQLCIRDVRNMAYDLYPPELDQLGLIKAVAKFCEDFSEREKIEIDFSDLGVNEDLLNREISINFYRIIQEALNNIKKHAEATRVNIKLISSFPEIILRIEDNGKGFDVEGRKAAALSEKRMGLENMKDRIRLFSGEIAFQSQKNKGTTIIIKIQYNQITT
jgi:PAS domain S-box-containing protein